MLSLNDKCHQIVIGTYASQKAYRANFVYGNVYQASVDFLRTLAQTYKVTPNYVTTDKEGNPSFARISRLFESRHDFSTVDEQLTAQDKSKPCRSGKWSTKRKRWLRLPRVFVSCWQMASDIRIFWSYLVMRRVISFRWGRFSRKFDIPYYFGKEETMSSHPLVQFVDSLERIKRYNYRAEDLLNLVKIRSLWWFCSRGLRSF